MIKKEVFGIICNEKINILTLENSFLKVKILNYGGIIQSLIVKDKNIDIVLGYNTLDEYVNDDSYMGAIIGRVANCLENAKFKLNDIEYTVSKNNGNHSQHGGFSGFNKKIWTIDKITKNSLRLYYLSKDGEEGYPGNLKVYAVYKLVGKNLIIEFTAYSDKDTIVNMTTHSYFNLNGEGNKSKHLLQVCSDSITPVDSELITHNEYLSVKNTKYDFNNEHLIDEDYDINYVLKKSKNVVNVKGVDSKIHMVISTNQKGLQLYTANELSTRSGKTSEYYPDCAICLEPQAFPNSINCANYTNVVLRKRRKYHFITKFSFSNN